VLCLWTIKKFYKFATLKTFVSVTYFFYKFTDTHVWLFSTTTNFTVTGVW